VEPHAHLDKAFTFAAFPNLVGTIDGAMEANRREAQQRTHEEVLRRGGRALELAWRHGLRAIRSHIDSLGPQAEPSWEAIDSLRKHWQGRVELQSVALVPIDHWSTPQGEALARRVARSGGWLGGVLGAPYPPQARDGQGLLALLRLAEHHGTGVDLHVDESDANAARGLLLLLEVLQRHRIRVPLVGSHACSMALLDERRLLQLADALAAAEIGIVALPPTNLWLLDRRPHRAPRMRLHAPIRELQSAGVVVAVGGDNVQDPWYPAGHFDPLALMGFSLAASHLAPWHRLGLSPFTTAAARLLRLDWDGVLRIGGPADLVVLASTGWADMLAAPPGRRVLRGGRWVPPHPPDAPHRQLLDLIDSLP
jgi:cytosine deaminase